MSKDTKTPRLVNNAINEGKLDSPKVAVDWGGDKGQFIPDFPNLTKRLVYEVLNSVAIEGVARTDLIDEGKLARPDLVLLCHVLEHDHDAREDIRWLSLMMIKESVLFIEILEGRSPIVPRTKRNSALLSFLLRYRIAFIVIDAYSLCTIRFLGKNFPFQFLKQSEYVNFICRKSIVKVTQEYGFEVVEETRHCMNKSNSKSPSNALGLLLKKI